LRGLPRWERPYATYAASLKKLLKELRPDVVHAHFGTAGVIAELALRDLATPLVVTFYGHDISHLPLQRGWPEHYRRLFQRARGVTVLSADMRTQALTLGACPAETHVIHLARAVDQLPFAPRPGRIQRWLSIGRLFEKKGFEDTIRAFARLRDKHVESQLEIIGEGPLFPALRALVDELGLGGSVRLRGAQPASTVVQALTECDAFVLCSKTARNGDKEGTPTVLIEAQAIGRPCVSTWHAGIPEMLPEQAHWLLAREGAVSEIAERMEKLCDLPELARRQLMVSARQHVERDFSVDAQANRFSTLYSELSATGRGAT
jgi:glycosyltransferase involved in cell wall biosynthesis